MKLDIFRYCKLAARDPPFLLVQDPLQSLYVSFRGPLHGQAHNLALDDAPRLQEIEDLVLPTAPHETVQRLTGVLEDDLPVELDETCAAGVRAGPALHATFVR